MSFSDAGIKKRWKAKQSIMYNILYKSVLFYTFIVILARFTIIINTWKLQKLQTQRCTITWYELSFLFKNTL